MRILLARHGETPWNAEGRYQGQEDIPLSPVGEEQARLLGERLRDVRIDKAVSSPLTSADHTAQFALGQGRAPMLTTETAFREIAHGTGERLLASGTGAPRRGRRRGCGDAPDTVQLPGGEAPAPILTTAMGFTGTAHGTWEGVLASEIGATDPERLRAWRDAPDTVQMPGGESLKQVCRRSWEALQWSTEGLGGNDTLLVVAHDAVNRVLLCHVLGIPLSRLWTFRQAPTTLNLLEGETLDSLEVVRLNDCSHHTAFFGEAVHRAL